MLHAQALWASCSSPVGLWAKQGHRPLDHMQHKFLACPWQTSLQLSNHYTYMSQANQAYASFNQQDKMFVLSYKHEFLSIRVCSNFHYMQVFGPEDHLQPSCFCIPNMPSVYVEQWQDPITLALFERVWVSSYWRRSWTRHDAILYCNARYALRVCKMEKTKFKAKLLKGTKKVCTRSIWKMPSNLWYITFFSCTTATLEQRCIRTNKCWDLQLERGKCMGLARVKLQPLPVLLTPYTTGGFCFVVKSSSPRAFV